jgi:lysophospholipase L1-like esterase
MEFGLGGSPRPVVPLGPIPPGGTVLFAGDSITAGYNFPGGGTLDPSFRWCAPFEAYLTAQFTAAGKTPPTYANTGVIGQRSDGLLAALNTNMIAPGAQDIFLCIGTNDVSQISAAATFSDMTQILSGTIAAIPAVRIRVISLLWAGEQYPKTLNSSFVSDGYDLRNGVIWSATKQFPAANVQWLYVRDLLYATEALYNTPAPGAASGFQTQDGTHPSKTGQQPAGQSGAEVLSGIIESMVTLQLT